MLEMGGHYTIKLFERWNQTKYYKNTYLVAGITTYDKIEGFADFDLRGELFTPIGISISDYIAMVYGKKIYILNEVVSRDPIEIDDDKIFIPESIIDHRHTMPLIVADKLRLSTKPFVRHFANLAEERDYIDNLTQRINRSLMLDGEFFNEDLDPTFTQEECLEYARDIEIAARIRQEEIDKNIYLEQTKLSQEEHRKLEFENKRKELNTQLSLVEEQREESEKLFQEATEEMIFASEVKQVNDRARLLLMAIIDLLRQDGVEGIPSWSELEDLARVDLGW